MFSSRRTPIWLGLLCGALVGQADVAEFWQKARKLTGIAQNDAPRASVQVKCGKVSRMGVASVSMSVTPFFGTKFSYGAQKVTLPASGTVVVKWPDGARIEIAGNGISGSLPDGRVLAAWTPGSNLADGTALDLETDGLADTLPGLFEQYLPVGLAVQSDARGRWTVAGGAKTGKVVYLRGTQTVDESKLGANPAGLKLSYAPKTGIFKGSFKAWQDVKGKIKGVAAKVSGIVVDGKGFGEAKIGKLAPCAVRIVGGVNPVPVPDGTSGVQLWKNGPYWAECNVGASRSEECGYYFWWGDTVGYKRTAGDDGWISVKNGVPFTFLRAFPTYDESISALQSQGYIDSTGNLVAKYDAATAYLGAPWRMPTAQEIDDLVNKCTTTWTKRNGVYGRLVTGKGAYASKHIFLPAAGDSDRSGSYLDDFGSGGFYWSSTCSGESDSACDLCFSSSRFRLRSDDRNDAHTVRAVR